MAKEFFITLLESLGRALRTDPFYVEDDDVAQALELFAQGAVRNPKYSWAKPVTVLDHSLTKARGAVAQRRAAAIGMVKEVRVFHGTSLLRVQF